LAALPGAESGHVRSRLGAAVRVAVVPQAGRRPELSSANPLLPQRLARRSAPLALLTPEPWRPVVPVAG